MEVLKNLGGNINFDPDKFKVKVVRQNHSQEYRDAWNNAIEQLDSAAFDDDLLDQIQAAIMNS
jgi:hypothetical protein